jgi:hypothetical protein
MIPRIITLNYILIIVLLNSILDIIKTNDKFEIFNLLL